ncbi:hypothetical protein QZH41_020449, partial [Actinostola sp. cb2023]
TEAFEDLLEVTETLGDIGQGMGWAKRQQLRLRESKRYLKSDYKVHVSKRSTVADHCRDYALSDPKEPAFQSSCDHEHTDICDRCEMLSAVIQEIEAELASQNDNMSSVLREQLSYRVKQAKNTILAWKSHLLRSVNQDAARVEVLESLDASSVLLVQDWAMKYLPRKFKESQTDWFGKRGIPWHVTVATRKNGLEHEMLTFVHIFPSCSQDSCAVIAVMADVIKQLKITMPSLTSVFYRQDNAGCYHCGATITCARVLGLHDEVTIKRLDFSDPQGGKGSCDRKAVTIKSHMRIHLNSGNDIETQVQMKDAIMSAGGVPAVNVTLCESVTASKMATLKIEGVSLLNNIKYEVDGIRVWRRAFDIGPGKLIPTNKLQSPSPSELSAITCTSTQPNSFVSVKQRRNPILQRGNDGQEKHEDESEVADISGNAADAIFACPEEGCTQTFLRHSSMQRHLDCGKHQRALERETLLDRAALAYAETLEGQRAGVPHLDTHATMRASSHCDSSLSLGWALKSGASRRVRFTSSQISYLAAKFRFGEQSGQKADLPSVARAMMTARDADGNPLFTRDDFLTPTQVASYFSRLASKKHLGGDDEVLFDDIQSATNEAHMEHLVASAAREVGLAHPITYDIYNLCDMCSSSKLKNLSIPLLKDICTSFDINTSDVTIRRKQPYIQKIMLLYDGCTCQK